LASLLWLLLEGTQPWPPTRLHSHLGDRLRHDR